MNEGKVVYHENNLKIINYLNNLILIFPVNWYYIIINKNNDLYVTLKDNKKFINIVFFLLKYTKSLCKQLIDICIIDCLYIKYRFIIIYNFLSLFYNFRLRLRLLLVNSIGIETLLFLYKSANWLERENWDMFGIFFYNHIDLRRILTDYGFIGFPLRKDFPLSGFYELIYNDLKSQITFESVELSQVFRVFVFKTTWNWFTKSFL